jgi:hypothetical protein
MVSIYADFPFLGMIATKSSLSWLTDRVQKLVVERTVRQGIQGPGRRCAQDRAPLIQAGNDKSRFADFDGLAFLPLIPKGSQVP